MTRFPETISVLAANALAASIWEGLLVALAVWIALRLLPGVSAAVRSSLWTAVFAVVALLHLAPLAEGSHAVASSGAASAVHLDPRWSVAVAALWLGLSAWRGTQLLVSAVRLRGIAHRAIPVEDGARRIGRRSYVVCTSEEVDRPSVAGFFRPRVLLPPSLFATLTATELHHVLLHETEHLRRADDWTNLLQKAALVVFPLNPVLVWVERRLCLERELACDDRVLAETGAPKAYASCLTSMAERSLLRRGISLALGAWGKHSELSQRVHRILAAPQRTLGARAAAGVTGAMLVALGGGAYRLAHAPALISFSPVAASVRNEASFAPAAIRGTAFPAAHFQTASFREPVPAAPRVQPRKAAVTMRHPAKRTVSVRPRILKAEQSVPVLQQRVARRAELEGRLVLTSAGDDQISYTFVPAVVRTSAYAAIPVPNGWIIFQL